MTTTTEQNPNIYQLARLIENIDCGMLTTIDEDGSLHSRPMERTSDIQADGTIWFFTNASTHKVFEIKNSQQVNISFKSDDAQRYISISGIAELLKDRQQMQHFWKPELQAWFPQGLDEPDIALLKINITRADYWDSESQFQQQTITF